MTHIRDLVASRPIVRTLEAFRKNALPTSTAVGVALVYDYYIGDIMKLAGIMLGTQDVAKLAQFYTKLLGEPGFHQDDWYGWGTPDSTLMLGSHSEVHGKNSNPQRLMVMLNVEDVQKAFDQAKSAGAEVIAEPYEPDHDNNPDMFLATVADPDGNYVQLSKPWDSANM
jgi:predicted enzyme related to lactoylglutathione lyase